MARFSIVFRPNKEGEGTLLLMCAHNHTLCKRSIGIHLSPNQWDKGKKKVVNHPREAAINARMASVVSDANLKTLELSELVRLRSLTASQLIEMVMGDDDKKDVTLFSLFERFIQMKRAEGTKVLYRKTMESLKRYDRKIDGRHPEDITTDYLYKYDEWLQSHGSPSPNARGIHFRNLRAVMNFAIDEEVTTHYPFRKFTIPSCETPKRAIPVEDMRRFFADPGRIPSLFCLSFCLCGMNLVDLASLTKANIKGDRVEYYRRKTGKFYSILLTPKARELMERVKGKRHLIYILDNAKCVDNAKTFINSSLKRICPGVSFYSARHSFATYLNDLGVSREVISEALGHEYGSKITSIYIKPNQQAVDDALEKVIAYVLGEGQGSS